MMTNGYALRLTSLALQTDTSSFPTWEPNCLFDFTDSKNLPESRSIPEAQRATVRQEILDACHLWRNTYQTHYVDDSGTLSPFIDKLLVSHSPRTSEILTASSPGAKGSVVVSAEWPIGKPDRLASLLVHEAVHQGLFSRERSSSPVRRGSLGYSPWKKELRPGRMVWHAYWTFSTQFAYLCGLLHDASFGFSFDASSVDFIFDMRARLEFCLESVSDFSIVGDDELVRMSDAMIINDQVMSPLFLEVDAAARLNHLRSKVAEEVENWRAERFSSAEVM